MSLFFIALGDTVGGGGEGKEEKEKLHKQLFQKKLQLRVREKGKPLKIWGRHGTHREQNDFS